MRILTRYVLFDLLKVFLLTLTALTLLIFIVLIGKEFVDKGIGLGPLLRMAPYLIPQAMQFAVPGTMLLATTSVYGRMASPATIQATQELMASKGGAADDLGRLTRGEFYFSTDGFNRHASTSASKPANAATRINR